MKKVISSGVYLLWLMTLSLQIISSTSYGQVLDLESSTDGFLAPRMNTTQRDNITNLADGLIIYNTSTSRINYYDLPNAEWLELYPNSVLEYFVSLPNGLETLITAGESIQNMLDAGATVQALYEEGVTIQALCDIGVTIPQLLAAGVPISELLSGGKTIQEVVDAGVTLQQLLTGEITPEAILVGTTSFTTSNFLGLNYGGGIIFYLENDGSGYISAATDQGTIPWGCSSMEIDGADGDDLGTGLQNTLDILDGCNDPIFAAKVCDTLMLNNFGDWFMPSWNELQEMYDAIGLGATGSNQNIGNFVLGIYLSSTESSSTSARTVDFTNGARSQYSKSFPNYYVRAIREIKIQ